MIMTTLNTKTHGTRPKLKLKANLHHEILWLKEGMKIYNKQNNKIVQKKVEIGINEITYRSKYKQKMIRICK